MKIVREKYMSQLPGAKDKLEMQRFLSQLYIFLVDQMHVGLKKGTLSLSVCSIQLEVMLYFNASPCLSRTW